ncbi:MAG: hypothetical protein Kow0068_22210 [Marinilabiliales bacterium]
MAPFKLKNSPILSIIIGVAVIIFGIYSYFSQKEFLENSVETVGVVVDVVQDYSSVNIRSKKYSSDNSMVFKPVVEFQDKNGNTYTFKSSRGSKYLKTYEIGKKLTVLYNPDNPEKAMLKSAANKSTTYISGAAGILFILIGLGAKLFGNKMPKVINQ